LLDAPIAVAAAEAKKVVFCEKPLANEAAVARRLAALAGMYVLARDRLGIKPLYLAEGPGWFRFASTLPALVSPGDVDTTVDPVALHHYLTFHAIVPSPRTILSGVTKLPPATVLEIDADGHRRQATYWRPTDGPDTASIRTPAEWQEAVGAALRLAVKRRLVADVPVGVLLSGGLDSSLIVGLLRESGQDDLSTFSIGFDTIGDEEGDEFRWSDAVAAHFDTDHHQIKVPTARVLEALPSTIAAMSEPMVSHDVVAFYLLSEEVSRHVKVVQSGQGADEVFGGYHWYQKLAVAAGDGVDRYASLFFDRDHAAVTGVVSPDYQVDDDVSRAFVADYFDGCDATTPLERALRIDTHVMLVEDPVKRVDNTTMAWGLEGRVPFLDHELVELATSCPSELLVADGGKGILKDLARDVVPHEVIDRPKGYFPVPPLIQLEGPYVDLLADALQSPAAVDRGLFRPDQVRHLLDHPNELTTLRYNKLWELGLLELWLQAVGA